MANDYHTIYISAKGDESAGIPGIQETLERLFLPDLDMNEERERVRRIFTEAFSELWDDKAYVRFEDECPDCGKLKVNCICMEK